MRLRGSSFLIGLAMISIVTAGFVSGDDPAYSFSVGHVEDVDLWLKCETGCSWKEVSYGGGAFYVSKDGVKTAKRDGEGMDSPGVVLELSESTKSLVMTCHATRCTVAEPVAARSEHKELRNGEWATIPAAPGTKFTVMN